MGLPSYNQASTQVKRFKRHKKSALLICSDTCGWGLGRVTSDPTSTTDIAKYGAAIVKPGFNAGINMGIRLTFSKGGGGGYLGLNVGGGCFGI